MDLLQSTVLLMAASANSSALLSVESLSCWDPSHLGKGARASVCPSVESVRAPTRCSGRFVRVPDVDMPQGGVCGDVGVPVSGLAFIAQDPPALIPASLVSSLVLQAQAYSLHVKKLATGGFFPCLLLTGLVSEKLTWPWDAADGELLPNPERGLRCARVAKVFT